MHVYDPIFRDAVPSSTGGALKVPPIFRDAFTSNTADGLSTNATTKNITTAKIRVLQCINVLLSRGSP